MEKKGWKQIAAGVAVSIVGIVGLTSCENKKENQDENKKPQTEQNDYKYTAGQIMLNDVRIQNGYPAVKSADKAGDPDSILTGVEASSVSYYNGSRYRNKFEYKNPTYKVQGKKDPRKVKIADIKRDTIEEAGKSEYKIEFTYDDRTPEDSIREAKEKIEALKEFNKRAENWKVYKSAKSDNNEWKVVERRDKYSSVVENDYPEARLEELEQKIGSMYHERAAFKDKDLKVEFGYQNASTQDDFDASQEQVSALQDKPEKKEPPKGSISKDAFINEFLRQKRDRGGKKS